MKSNFPKCLAEVLKHEGGWADHPEDPGGATMKGITIGTYRQYRPGATKEQLRNISDADVERIYRDGYWNPVRGDDLPAGLDLVAFDAAVNSGVSRGARWVQQALGVTADGQIGPMTIAAAKKSDAVEVIDAALDIRMAFLRSLRTFPTFGRGWTRRVDSVRAVAKAMSSLPAPTLAAKPSGPWAGVLASLAGMFRR